MDDLMVTALRKFEAHYPCGINPFLDEAAKMARKALAEYDARPSGNSQEGWQPIETAPRDGTLILVAGPVPNEYGLYRSTGVWKDGAWLDSWFSEEVLFPPSHWTELIAAPTAAPAEAFGIQPTAQQTPAQIAYDLRYSIDYMVTYLEDAPREVVRNWKRVQAAATAATPSPQREEGESIPLYTKGAVDAVPVGMFIHVEHNSGFSNWLEVVGEHAEAIPLFRHPPVQPAHDKGEGK